jgi:hypothetical protein
MIAPSFVDILNVSLLSRLVSELLNATSKMQAGDAARVAVN